ncbi:MAG TPA: serine hydrolase domain-containing protein [Actinomycetota bacterium]|nr:serine hydrolase domain-containing protein [Actinomycetota bacterium]
MDPGAQTARLRSGLDRCWEGLRVPGAAIALTNRQGTLGVWTFGVADLATGRPLGEEDLFQIASVSKSFTAAALMLERERGTLELDAPATAYLPWFEVRSPFGPITVHHLLSHTAGIVTGHDFTGEGVAELLALTEQEPGFAPGERFHYSNAGYKALGLILERLAGRSYGEAIRDRILRPLGMSATEPVITDAVWARCATGHVSPFEDRPWHSSYGLVAQNRFESGTGDGTVCTSPGDLATYLRMYLNDGAGVLARESVELMTRGVARDEEAGVTYGYGLWTDDRGGRRLVGHSGSFGGFTSMVMMDREAGLGAAVLCNGPAGWEARREVCAYVVSAARSVAEGGEPPDPPDLPAAHLVPGAAEYQGLYRGPSGTLQVHADGDRLLVDSGAGPFVAERLGPDRFVSADPELALFPLRFVRAEGVVTEVVHGGDRYAASGRPEPDRLGADPTRDAFVGHYRLPTPLSSDMRVVARDGALHLYDLAEDAEYELAPLGGGRFRVGAEPWAPGRIRFDSVIDGRAVRAIWDGAPYYRVFTP